MNKLNTLKKFQSFNERLTKLIDKVNGFDQATLDMTVDGEWTIMELIEHLFLVEKISLKYIKYKVDQGAKFTKSGIKQKFNAWVMKRVYRANRKVEAPESVRPQGVFKDLESLTNEYVDMRRSFYAFLNDRQEHEYDLNIFKTKMFGRMPLFNMMIFLEEHFLRHEKQLDRILTKLKNYQKAI